jgi:hypothetical protein
VLRIGRIDYWKSGAVDFLGIKMRKGIERRKWGEIRFRLVMDWV